MILHMFNVYDLNLDFIDRKTEKNSAQLLQYD